MIESFEEAVDLLHEAQEAYRNDECSEALSMYYDLAHWVASAQARSSVPAGLLVEFARKVRCGVAGYQNCESECLWEKASSLMDIFLTMEGL